MGSFGVTFPILNVFIILYVWEVHLGISVPLVAASFCILSCPVEKLRSYFFNPKVVHCFCIFGKLGYFSSSGGLLVIVLRRVTKGLNVR